MAEEEAEKPKEMIKLVSKEGHEFSVEKQAAMVSGSRPASSSAGQRSVSRPCWRKDSASRSCATCSWLRHLAAQRGAPKCVALFDHGAEGLEPFTDAQMAAASAAACTASTSAT